MSLIPPPKNFQFSDDTLSWDAVAEAERYEILYRLDILGSQWAIAYDSGNATSCPFDKPVGTYKMKGKTQSNTGPWGSYGDEETIVVGS